MRRIQAARCIANFPEVYELLDKNALNLSTVCIAAKVLTAGDKAALLARICGKSQRDVEAIAAEFEPRESMPKERVRTVVVRQPLRVPRASVVLPLLNRTQDNESTEVEQEASPADLETRTMIQFSADSEFMDDVARVRSFASHRLPANVSFEALFAFTLKYFLRHEGPKERMERREAKPVKRVERVSANPRHIPASLRDQVFVRDQGMCTFVGPAERRCGSTHAVQIDHIVPLALGGKSAIDNLRLLCGKHNRLEAERVLGGLLPLR